MVELLFYSTIKQGAGARFQSIIEKLVPKEDIGIFRTMESLSSRLHQFPRNMSLAVILAASQKELFELLLIRDCLKDIPLILILPDRESETISKGHKLYPRFISYLDSGFEVFEEVFRTIIGRLDS